jgi:hypothetical protein
LRGGIRLSKLNAELRQIVDLPFLVGRAQRSGLVRIVYDLEHDEEPLVQLTEKGKQVIDLAQALQDTT